MKKNIKFKNKKNNHKYKNLNYNNKNKNLLRKIIQNINKTINNLYNININHQVKNQKK